MSIILAAEIQMLVEKYGEEAVKEALMKCIEKDLRPECPEE